jgi:hypothetical protein
MALVNPITRNVILQHFDSCLLQQLDTLLESIRLSVNNYSHPRIDNESSAVETGLMSAGHDRTLKRYSPSSSEGYGILFGMDCKTLLRLMRIVAVRHSRRCAIVALNQDSTISGEDSPYLEPSASGSFCPKKCCVEKSGLSRWPGHPRASKL